MTSSDFSCSLPSDFDSLLIPRVTVDVGHRLHETSLVPPPTFTAFRSPYAEEFLKAALRILHLFHALRQRLSGSALLCPFRANITTLQDSLLWYGLLFCTSFSEGYLASAPPVTQEHWRPATWLSGDYHGRTSTG